LKHYVGYGAAEGGRDYNTTEISEYTLRNFYLPQYRSGVDAGALTVMSAFNCLSGMPASGTWHTLTGILRKEWNFRGYVVSDWASVTELIPQGVAANESDAARLALYAGVDMEMVSTTYSKTLSQQVKDGQVPESEVTEAARRVLRVKFEKGLFDRPYVDETLYSTAFLRPDALALAREVAAKSCVLLKNTDHALPISRQTKSVALLGPFADATGDLLGCWAARGRASDVVTLGSGIRSKLASGAGLSVIRGCEAAQAATTIHRLDGTQVVEGDGSSVNAEADIARAVAAARDADTVILALGEPSSWSGENSSRSSLDIPGRQMELFDAVAALGKPVIVVLINGRPLAFPKLVEKAAAILEAWNPGVEGGLGVADVLFGDVDPAGRLTTSFPRNVGQVPIYYNHYNTGRPDMGKYVDGPSDPLFPFGFGLTYTSFVYSDVQLDAESMSRSGALYARVRVKNVGVRAGTEVAQLYIRQLAGSAGPRPVRELRGFQKVRLEPGQERTLEFKITSRELGYYNPEGHRVVDAGKFLLWIAKDSASGAPVELEVAK
jgi:beta-glucosidase